MFPREMLEYWNLKEEDCFKLAPPSEWKEVNGFSLIGMQVSSAYGKDGVITAVDDWRELVEISILGERMVYPFPYAFDCIFAIKNKEYQCRMQNYIKLYDWRLDRLHRRSSSTSRVDRIEDSVKYSRIKDELHQLIVKKVGEFNGIGYCHYYWQAKKSILKEKYGVDWKSPAELNPGIRFD